MNGFDIADLSPKTDNHFPAAALVFINWNSADLVLAAWRSAVAETTSLQRLRLIIVDNASTDGSVEKLRRALPGALILEHSKNRGFAAAVNTGLAAVSQPYAFILNADIEFRAGAIDRLVAALNQDPKAVLACPDLLRPDGSRQAAAVTEPRLFWELFNRSLPRRRLVLNKTNPTVVPGVVGPCMALHMERLRQTGPMDERFFFFFEETDWCKRITDSGAHVLFVPDAAVVHLQGESANRRPVRARVQFYDSRYRYFRKHWGRGATLVLYGGLFFKLTVNVLVYALLIVLTCGHRRIRDKFAVYGTLWYWHVLGTRPRWGFEE